MVDHAFGRPSLWPKRLQVVAIFSLWTVYFSREHKHRRWPFDWLSKYLSKRLTNFQSVNLALMAAYLICNVDKLIGLGYQEPFANMYSPSFFRATRVLTALDAGFWSAMPIQNKYLREVCELLFSLYYLLAPDRADEKVRKVRQCLTVKHLRTSWNKPNSRYLSLLTRVLRPRYMSFPPRQVCLPRPENSTYSKQIKAWLYFDGPISSLKEHTKIFLDIPGGGFIAMDPRCNDDRLMCWAGQLGLPILSLDYKKALEYPYPYALNECFDVYRAISTGLARHIGLHEGGCPRILLSEDSAGGNLATALTLKILEHNENNSGLRKILAPEGLLLIYPALDFNIGSWMSDSEIELMQSKRIRRITKELMRGKSNYFGVLAAKETPQRNVFDIQNLDTRRKEAGGVVNSQHASMASFVTDTPGVLDTQLAVCSMISFTNDRILTQEMMRAMIILYIGPSQRPNFKTDYLLSPLVAPDTLLADFPPTYIITGERDPLVDNTVLFAERLRRAREMYGSLYDEDEVVEVHLIPGISHGFMQMAQVYSPAKSYFKKTAIWISKMLKTEMTDTSLTYRPQWGMFKETAISGEIFQISREPLSKSAHLKSSNDTVDPTTTSASDFISPQQIPDQEISQVIPPVALARVTIEVTQASRKDTISLAPDEDLISRRMKLLAGGLKNI